MLGRKPLAVSAGAWSSHDFKLLLKTLCCRLQVSIHLGFTVQRFSWLYLFFFLPFFLLFLLFFLFLTWSITCKSLLKKTIKDVPLIYMMAEHSLRRWENVVIFQRVFSIVYLEGMLKASLGKDTSFGNWAIVFNTKTQMSKFSEVEKMQSCMPIRAAFQGTGDTWPWDGAPSTFKTFL